MHLQSRALRNSPKFNEIQCIVCAGKLVFLTMHSFYFVFKTFPMPISFSLSFLVFFFFLNIAWVFWIYFSSLCNCARVVWAGLSRTVTGGSGRGAVLERGEEGPVPIAHPRPTPPPSIRALPFPSSGYLLASFLAITHKSWVLIANEIFISFLCFLTLPLKTHLWGIRDKKKKKKTQQINHIWETAEMVSASVPSEAESRPRIISLPAWVGPTAARFPSNLAVPRAHTED